MFALLFLLLVVGFLIALPLILIGLLIRVVIGVALIPLRIVGFAVRATLGLALGLVGVIVAGTLLLVPLLPIVALALVVWMIVRLMRRSPAARLAVD